MAVSHWEPVDPVGSQQQPPMVEDSSEPVVVIPVYDAAEDFQRCLRSIVAHTPEAFDIVIIDDHGPDRRGIDAIDDIGATAAHRISVLHQQSNGGFVQACNDAFALTGQRDVIIVNSDVIVGPHWAERLTAAARSSSLIATASALTNHGTIVSVPERNRPTSELVEGRSVDWCAQRVADHSLQLRPELPTAIGHCMFIKRSAVELLGGFDPVFGRGYGEEVDFSQRAVTAGFRHICADDVFVYHRGGGSFGDSASLEQQANEQIIAERYPWYHPWVARAATDRHSPLAHAIERASIALRGLRIGFDATGLGHQITGTARVTLETAAALASTIAARRSDDTEPRQCLVVFHRPEMAEWMRDRIDGSAGEFPVEFVEVTEYPAPSPDPQVDVIYRATQVVDLGDLGWLRSVGHRVVIGQLDLIAHRNPSYFVSDDDWAAAQRITEFSLAMADGVVFISEFGRAETMAAGSLVPGTPNAVVYTGVDSTPVSPATEQPGAPAAVPAGLAELNRPFMVCLGAGYRHKNRVFAVSVLAELRQRGWNGVLVFAGPRPPGGGTGDDEAEAIERSGLHDVVIDLGSVSEPERAWLLGSAALSLYPTVSEGFGLIPFESAAFDTPTLTSRQASLAEVLPSDLRAMDGYDISAWADEAWRLLHDTDAAHDNVASIRRRAGEFSWERSATIALGIFDEVMDQPANRVAAVVAETTIGALATVTAPTDTANADDQRDTLDAAIGRLAAGPLKRMLAPEHSRRQALARRTANALRRQRDRRAR